MADGAGGEIRPNKHGKLQVQRRKTRKDGFNDTRKTRFLTHFASTGNVTAAAEAAGMSINTIYEHRTKDPAFREAWAAAQENCYAALEAELVRRGHELLTAASPQNEDEIRGMDAKLAFSILQNFQKKSGQQPGDIVPRKSDLAEATKRLEAAMRSFKLLPPPAAPGDDAGESDEANKGDGAGEGERA